MDLRQIEYFLVVARQQNFTRAARAMGLAQPALSQQMKRLEEELGVILLDRSTRPLTLTEAGHAFEVRAERILADARLAREEMREYAGVGRGKLVIGALPALAAWLPGVLATFHAAHPLTEMILREENTEELARLVGSGQLDLAVLHAVPGMYPGDSAQRGIVMERLFDEELARLVGSGQLDLAVLHAVPGMYTGDSAQRGIVMERLFDEELVAIVAPGHPLAQRKVIELRELRKEAFVLRSRGSGLAHTIMAAMTAEGFAPRVSAEAVTMTSLRGLVSAGIGVSIIPKLSALTPGPPVSALPVRPALPSHSAAVAWRGDRQPSAAAEALLDVIRDHGAVARRTGLGLLSRRPDCTPSR